MASLQCRSGSWRVIFRHRGSQHFVALGAVDEVEADGIKARYEYLLRLLKQRLLHLPPGMDIVCFLRYDGKPSETSPALDQPELTLARIRDEYFETIGNGAVEKNTLYTARIHLAHIAETLGERFLISSLSHADLQRARELKPRIGCLSTFVQLFPRTPESEPIVGWRPALSHGLPFPSQCYGCQTGDQKKRRSSNTKGTGSEPARCRLSARRDRSSTMMENSTRSLHARLEFLGNYHLK